MRPLILTFVLAACAPASVASLLDGGGVAPDVTAAADVPASSPDVPASPPDVSASPPDVPASPLDVPASPPDVPASPPDVATAGSDRPAPPTDTGEPPWVDVDLRTRGTCPPLSRCGGDVRGTWDVAGVCLEVPIEDALGRCPGARVTRRAGRARGRVTFADALAIRRAEWTAEVQVLIPALCAALVGGCPGIQSSVRAVAPDTTCVAMGLGDCDCTVRQAGGLNDGDVYRLENNQIVSASLGRRWDYCIDGDALRYRDVSAREPREPGTITLRRVAR
ncbi:MAG: hypothetical protein U0325_07885 [Polyangiales bacterium]